jgi:FkbM family methyltransferase
MISYAQNFEDVILLRALSGVGKGSYIDVGAWDPVLDSVTKAFYERGWRGINLEPVDHWFQRLVADRPEDVNLRLAAWSERVTVKVFEVPGTGRSTVDADFARKCLAEGFTVEEQEIAGRPLDGVCAEFGVEEVHFLKIDVEGAETEVLRGMALKVIRPWIVLVEATEPNSRVSTHEKWEHLLTGRGYEFVYFDGLNRFYLASEHLALKSAFSTPPNYFDDFMRYSEWLAQQRAASLESEHEGLALEVETLRSALVRAQGEVGRAKAEREAVSRVAEAAWRRCAEESRMVVQLSRDIRELHDSQSMRITAPLRSVNSWLRSTTRSLPWPARYVTVWPREVLHRVALRAARQPTIRKAVRRLLSNHPSWRAPEDEANSRSSRFAIAESMQPVVDVEEVRNRLRRAGG